MMKKMAQMGEVRVASKVECSKSLTETLKIERCCFRNRTMSKERASSVLTTLAPA